MIVLDKYSVGENVKCLIQLVFIVNIVMKNSVIIFLRIKHTDLKISNKSVKILY